MSLKDNLKTARKAKGWSQPELAREAGVSQQLISQIENGVPSAGKDMLPTIAAALGIEVTDLDPNFWKMHPNPAARSVANSVRQPKPASAVPLYASARGGIGEMVLMDSEVGPERFPLEGVRDAYAVYVVGDSMEPLFEQGDRVLVNPHKPPSAGSDVILQTDVNHHGERFAMVKRLVRGGGEQWELEQFNPPKRFKLPRKDWPTCHVIVGKYSRR